MNARQRANAPTLPLILSAKSFLANGEYAWSKCFSFTQSLNHAEFVRWVTAESSARDLEKPSLMRTKDFGKLNRSSTVSVSQS
jgi:hypothetical protein